MHRAMKFCLLALASVLLLSGQPAVEAAPRIHSSAFINRGTGGSNIQITPPAVTLTRTNPSGSSSPSEGFVSTMQTFAPDEISPGSSPKMIVNGSAVTTQADRILYHSDGSMRAAVLSYRVGSMAAGASTVDVVSSQNTAPSTTCSRTTADVSAVDIDVRITSLSNLGGGTEGSGTWLARINDAIALGGNAVQLQGSGPVRCEWKFIAPLKDTVGGTTHPWLYEVFYVSAWTNSDGTAGPLEYRAATINGSLGVNPSVIGTSTTSNTISNTGTVTFTTQTGLTFYTGEAIAARMAPGKHMVGTVTSYNSGTGALVLSLVDQVSSGTSTTWDLIAAPSRYTMTAALRTGGGAVTVRTISSVTVANHAGFWLSPADGLRDWTDGRTPFQIAINPTYALRSNLFPPVDPAITSSIADSAYTPATYSPMISGFAGSTTDARGGLGYTSDSNYYGEAHAVTGSTNSSGDREDIGPWPSWNTRAFVKQSPRHLQTERVRALVALHFNTQWRDRSVERIATLNNGSDDAGTAFPNMGTPRPTTYNANTSTQISTDLIVAVGGQNGIAGAAGSNAYVDMEHWPNLTAAAYLQFGDPEYLDMLLDGFNQALITQAPTALRNQNYTVSGTTYKVYGSVAGIGGNVRITAWGEAMLAEAATFTPTTWPESPYLTKLANDHPLAMRNLYSVYYPSRSNLAAAYPSLGLPWNPVSPNSPTVYRSGQTHMFQQHYEMISLAYQHMLRPDDTNILWLCNYLLGNYTDMLASGWGSDIYIEMYNRGGYYLDETTHQVVSTPAELGYFSLDGGALAGAFYNTLVPTAGSDVLTLGRQTANATATATLTTSPTLKLVVGDIIRPTAQLPNSSSTTTGSPPPPEAAFGDTLYVVASTFASTYTVGTPYGQQSVSTGTNTIKLSHTLGGTPIVWSAALPQGFSYVVHKPQFAPVGELAGGAGYNGPGAWGPLWLSAMKIATYAGITGASANLARGQVVVTTLNAGPNPPSNDNKFTFLSARP